MDAARLRSAFTLDLRSLALFRMGLAVVLLSDLVFRSADIVVFYTDAGLVPRSLLQRSLWEWSLHTLSGGYLWQIVLFAIAGAFGMAVLAGHNTRLATIGSWVLLVSLQNRDPYILQGADVLLRLLLFWAIFLPLGKRWALDSMRDDSTGIDAPAPLRHFSWAGVALILQIATLYLFGFLWKLQGVEWRNGSAVRHALDIEQMSTLFGRGLLRLPSILPALTYLTLALELAIAALILLPLRSQVLRTGGALLAILLHIFLALSLRLGPFPFVAIAASFALFTTWFWDSRKVPQIDDSAPTDPVDWRQYLAAALCVIMLWWNIGGLLPKVAPGFLTPLVVSLRLDQEWSMFAPSPREEDGWYVLPGTLRSGRVVDVARFGKEVLRSKPPVEDVYAQYPNERWAVYMMDLHKSPAARLLPRYAEFVCREWNADQKPDSPARLVRLEVTFHSRRESANHDMWQSVNVKKLHTAECPAS